MYVSGQALSPRHGMVSDVYLAAVRLISATRVSADVHVSDQRRTGTRAAHA